MDTEDQHELLPGMVLVIQQLNAKAVEHLRQNTTEIAFEHVVTSLNYEAFNAVHVPQYYGVAKYVDRQLGTPLTRQKYDINEYMHKLVSCTLTAEDVDLYFTLFQKVIDNQAIINKYGYIVLLPQVEDANPPVASDYEKELLGHMQVAMAYYQNQKWKIHHKYTDEQHKCLTQLVGGNSLLVSNDKGVLIPYEYFGTDRHERVYPQPTDYEYWLSSMNIWTVLVKLQHNQDKLRNFLMFLLYFHTLTTGLDEVKPDVQYDTRNIIIPYTRAILPIMNGRYQKEVNNEQRTFIGVHTNEVNRLVLMTTIMQIITG